MNIEQIKVRNGESIQKAWDRLVKWVESLKVQPNDMVSINETPNGVIVKVRREAKTFNHPFKVYGSTETIRVTSGLVNGQVPYINDKLEGWRRIDNRKSDGGKYDPEKTTPEMEIDSGKTKKNKTYICIEVESNDEGTIKNPETDLRIVQLADPEGEDKKKGYYPIALLYLDKSGKKIEQFFQVVHHNLRYVRQKQASENKKVKGNQHLFFPL
jgi:hypothetical protein